MTNPTGCLLLDASCLLNLYATIRLREISATIDARLHVADYVLEQEAIYTWVPDATSGQDEPVPVDVSPLVADGLLHVIGLESIDEQTTFVELASLVDDGEAVTGALAFHRGCSVATDDRKARRVFGERIPTVELVSTLDILKLWADIGQIAATDVRAAMIAMRSGASYIPGVRDPLYEWWVGRGHKIVGCGQERGHLISKCGAY